MKLDDITFERGIDGEVKYAHLSPSSRPAEN
jgi:hypothetical protein